MTTEKINWIRSQQERTFGIDYYYNNGKIWFRKAQDLTMFLLVFPG